MSTTFKSASIALSGTLSSITATANTGLFGHAAPISNTADSSPDGTTGSVTFATPGGTVHTQFGGSNSLNTNATVDGQTGVTKGDFTITGSTDPAVTTSGGGAFELFGGAAGLTYVNFGVWSLNPCANSSGNCLPSDIGAFAGGLPDGTGGQKPTATMPTTGSATYTGGAVGYVISSTGANSAAQFYGTSSLTANFGTGGITGSISGISAYSVNNGGSGQSLLGTMNTIGLTATISGSGFSGTTSVTGSAGTAFDITGATGSLTGSFYGPAAQDVAGVFSLSSSTVQVVGSLGAQTSAPTSVQQSATSFYETALIGGSSGNFTAAVQTSQNGNTWTTNQTTNDGSADGFTGTNTVTTPNGTVSVSYGGTDSVNTNATTAGISGVDKIGLTVTSSTNPSLASGDFGQTTSFASALGLQYADFGLWELDPCTASVNCSPAYLGSFGGAQPGYALTPVGAIPTTGYATYWGGAVGVVVQPTATNSNNAGVFYGLFGLTANFASNLITGSITQTQVYALGGSSSLIGSLNDIAITGTISGNTYSGTVTAGNSDSSGNPPTGFNISGATGQLVGGFYGPAAQETAGTFYLTGGANGTSLIGSFGGAQGTDDNNANLTATHFVSIDTISGSPGSNLSAVPDGIGTSLFQKTIDTSPDGFTKLVTYTTPGGTIVVEEGGAQPYSSTQSRDGQTNVEGGNLIILSSSDPAVTTAGGGNWEAFGATVGLKYVDFGIWNISPTGNTASSQTPLYAGAGGGAKPGDSETGSMPTTGSATYTGGAAGYVVKGGTGGEFYGTSSLTANFATGGGTVTGSISNINVYSFNNNALMGTMNSISISATISGAGNSAAEYSGTTSAQAGAGTAFDITGATGSIKGGFYGPSAQETAGTFQMSGGGAQIVGSFGAKTAAPSDRRLKLDIAPAGHLANGLALYSWRYLGGRHRFTGVMAQDLLADRRFAAAVIIAADGLMRVDYARIGYIPHDLATMTAEGEAAVRRYRATVH